MTNNNNKLGKMMKQRRLMARLTLRELAARSGVSPSYLGRIEKGNRFPSAPILRKIARPLSFGEEELFALAGYLSSKRPSIADNGKEYSDGQLDPYVARVLAQEPVYVQRIVLGIVAMLKRMTKGIAQ